jgi:hypothetical protein
MNGVPLLEQKFESPFEAFQHPRETIARVSWPSPDLDGDIRVVTVGSPSERGDPVWIQGHRGFRLTVSRLAAARTTVKDLIDAGELRPPGTGESLVDQPFGGVDALWRLPTDSGGDAFGWSYAVAFGWLRIASWQRPLTDPVQHAMLASLVFRDPKPNEQAR